MANPIDPCNAPPAAPFAGQLAITSPCEMLPLLRGALFQLMTQSFSLVRFPDGRELRFQQASIPQLRAEIATLVGMCTDSGQPRHGPQGKQLLHHRPAGAFLGPFDNPTGQRRY